MISLYFVNFLIELLLVRLMTHNNDYDLFIYMKYNNTYINELPMRRCMLLYTFLKLSTRDYLHTYR